MKKIIAVIIAIITFAVTFVACTEKGDEGTTSTTTTATEAATITTTSAETTITETTTKTKEKPTEPVLKEGMEEIQLHISEIPIELEGVHFKKAVFHKATEQMEAEYSEYGDDPYVHNRLYIFVEGDSADLEITYISQYGGGVNSSAFYEDHQLIWHDGLGEKPLDISLEDGEVTVSGFSPNVTEVTNQARMFQEFLEVEGVPVKLVTFIFI